MFSDQTSHLEISVFDHDVGGRDDIMGRFVHDIDSDLSNRSRSNVNMPIESLIFIGNGNVCHICNRLDELVVCELQKCTRFAFWRFKKVKVIRYKQMASLNIR